jgi:hypothetical protein
MPLSFPTVDKQVVENNERFLIKISKLMGIISKFFESSNNKFNLI